MFSAFGFGGLKREDSAEEKPAKRKIEFWYRQSLEPMEPQMPDLWHYAAGWRITSTNPPPIESGMATIRMTPQGKLLELLAIPEPGSKETKMPSEFPEMEIRNLFSRTGLDFTQFEKSKHHDSEVVSQLPFLFENPIVWQPKGGKRQPKVITVIVHRAIVYFWVREYLTTRPVLGRQSNWGPSRAIAADGSNRLSISFMLFVLYFISIPLAIYNLRHGRSDRQGAFRTAVYLLAINIILWVVGLPHCYRFEVEMPQLVNYLRSSTTFAFSFWLGYVTFEPLVRRFWPHALVSWKRILTGRFADPQVGRDFLIGSLVGFGLAAMVVLSPTDLKQRAVALNTVLDTSTLAAGILEIHQRAFGTGFVILVLLVPFRVLFKNHWLTAVVVAVCLAAVSSVSRPSLWECGVHFINCTVGVVVVMRYGFVSLLSLLFAFYLTLAIPLTAEFGTWYAGSGLFTLAVLAGLACCAFYTSTLAGRFALEQETVA